MPGQPYLSPKSRLWTVGATTSYLCVAVSGIIITALCFVGPAPTGTGWWVLLTLGLCTSLPGLVCAAGVALGKYRWEWVGTGPLAAGVGTLAAFEWTTIDGIWTLANPLLITAFALWVAGRGHKIAIADKEARQAALREILDGGDP